MRFILLIVFLQIGFGCNQNRKSAIIVGGQFRAEGNISRDTVYNGLIKFYDVKSNKLVRESYYKNGVREGLDLSYYETGELQAQDSFVNGLENGDAYIFGKNGELISKQYFYYGLRTGNNIDFEKGKPKYFWFCSLEHTNIFHLDYDSIKGKKITDLRAQYLYFYSHYYSIFDENDSLQKNIEYFLYTFNPPKFDFKYSLVLVDSTYKILSVLKEFDQNKPWSIFDFNNMLENANAKQAIKLDITDSINDTQVSTVKVLRKKD